MSGKNPYREGGQAPPKYLNDFSKALSNEVRILLAEVGQLRDERRALQYEIAELMAVKSKHGAGGEYTPDWRPKEQEGPPEPAPPPAVEAALPAPAKPGWRTVHVREERAKKSKTKALPPPAAAAPAPMAPQPQLPAWAQWKPNPLLAPNNPYSAPAPAASAPIPKPRAQGLFGPKTPPPK